MSYKDAKFGKNPENEYGTLTTNKKYDDSQKSEGGKYIGRFPTLDGLGRGYYETLAEAIRGGELKVDPSTSRDGIRIIELARESHSKGQTVQWS